MPIGPGLLTGTQVGGIYGIAPGDDQYVDHTGLNYTAQTDSNVAFYEVNAAGDTLEFILPDVVEKYDDAVFTLQTVFGPTDFDVLLKDSGTTLVSETSGFDSDVWRIEGESVGETIQVTNFDTTTAAIYPYLPVAEVQ